MVGNVKNSVSFRRIAVSMAAEGRAWPWKLLQLAVRENCRGNCRGLLWVAMLSTTEVATDRTTACSLTTTVAFAVKGP